MKALLLLYVVTLGSVSSWSITSWINNSFNDCIGSYNFLWNSQENCNTGKEILQNFDFDTIDDAPFTYSSPSHTPSKPRKNKNSKAQACFKNPKLLLDIGQVAQVLIQKNCSKSKLIFRGKLIKKDKYIEFSLECPESKRRFLKYFLNLNFSILNLTKMFKNH